MNRDRLGSRRVRVNGLNHRGDGVGRILGGPDEGLVVFVPGTVPGDLCDVRIVEKKRDYMRGKVAGLLEEGGGRQTAPCALSDTCGGCSWQHMSYSLQLQWKRKITEDALRRIAKIRDPIVRECIPSPEILGYRNKVERPIATRKGLVIAGFYKPYTHDVVSVDDCLLEHPEARSLVASMLGQVRAQGYTTYDERGGKGLIRHLVARVAPGTGETMAVLVATTPNLPHEREMARELMNSHENLKSVVLNTNREATNVIFGDKEKVLAGQSYITDRFGSPALGTMSFRISPRSFYQVNSPAAVKLYELALDAAEIRDQDTVFDVYSGIGTLTLFSARRASLAIGIEEVGAAVADAGRNAKDNGITNARFVRGKAERVLGPSIARYGRPDQVILDPPRAGADRAVLLSIARARPRTLVYVSCNPATLARDISILRNEGFSPRWVQPLDMFPQTPHVECVVPMSRAN